MGRSTGGGRSVFGKIFFSLFMLPFLGLGLWFTYLFAQSLLYQFETYSWPKLDCTVLSSHVEENPGAAEADQSYIFRVRYQWRADFAEGTSEVYHFGYYGSSEIGHALRLARRYAEGSETTCWVDPETPNTAVLALQSPWNVLGVLFPLIFVAVGAGGIYATWRTPVSKPSRLRTAISSKASKSMAGPGCLAAFFSIFLLAGLAFLVPFFLMPAYRTWSASDWPEASCLVEYCAVRSHPGDDSTTYSVDVLYSYEVAGEPYKSSQYDFFSGSDSEYDSKREFVDAHPAGTRAACFYNPDDPLEAVLRRDYSGKLLWALLPLVFVVVGGGGMAFSLAAWGRRGAGSRGSRGSRGEARSRVRVSEVATDSFGRRTLKPKASPMGRLLGGTAVALFWNGVTGVFVWLVVTNWRDGEGMGCLAAFLVPFVLIGILMLVNIPYQILALFNPRPELTFDQARLTPGSGTGLSWSFRGAAGRIRRLRITLEGTEKVTYRRGTDTRRDSHTFATIEILDSAPPHRLESGQAYVKIPADAMHTFEAPNNKIEWKLKMHGEIRIWPDVEEEFEIRIDPAG